MPGFAGDDCLLGNLQDGFTAVMLGCQRISWAFLGHRKARKTFETYGLTLPGVKSKR